MPLSLQAPGILAPQVVHSSVGMGLTSIGTDTLGEHAEGQQRVHEAQKAGGRERERRCTKYRRVLVFRFLMDYV